MTDERLLKRLQEAFRVESEARLSQMSLKLVEMESAGSGDDLVPLLDVVYRDAHSLKGAARAVQFTSAERICQALEEVLLALREDRLGLEPSVFDLLHSALRSINASIEDWQGNVDPASGLESRQTVGALLAVLAESGVADPGARSVGNAAPIPPTEGGGPQAPAGKSSPDPGEGPVAPHMRSASRPVAKAHLSDAIRVPVETMDALLRKSEELVRLKLMAREELGGLRAVRDLLEAEDQGPLPTGGPPGGGREAVHALIRTFEANLSTLTGLVDGLLQEVKAVGMLPFGTLFELFPVLVRDLARGRGLQVELTMAGSDIRVDRRVLAEIKDPLVHLLRNAIDHGFSGDAGAKGGGSPSGSITVTAIQVGANHVEVTVQDNGLGMDTEALAEAAVTRNLVSSDVVSTLTRSQLLSLALQSGVSTREEVTDLSGRGLGLAVVVEAVERLGGTLQMESEPGQGTMFRMRVPVALATLRGLLLRSSNTDFVIPTSEVQRLASFPNQAVRVAGGIRTVELGGLVLPLVSLAEILKGSTIEAAPDGLRKDGTRRPVHAVVLGKGGNSVALEVDAVEGEEELLAKSLGPQLGRVRNISGAAILGDGRVALILSAYELLKSARSHRGTATPLRDADAKEQATRPLVLVAEDSFTSRTLLKNILETAGYEVRTAVDGTEALSLLKTEPFQVLLSDVEMPRMNGLELTERVRADEKLANLPVILVSSLDRPEDRERGIAAGADAYVGKSTFDQASLLDTLRRYC